MASQSTRDELQLDTNAFYRRTLHVLSDAQVPFLVGGSHAFLRYTGIARDTKDLDVFVRRADLDDALEALASAGYRTELTFPHWLGKAIYGDNFVDLVFSSGNGVAVVDDEWFEHAIEAEVLGLPVKLMPAEEFVWQKAFIMERHRYDGADIMHILRSDEHPLDWDRLLRRFEPFWQLLLSHLVLFTFVYPCDRQRIPEHVMRSLLERSLRETGCAPESERVCQGTLLSREQFLVDIGRYGYRDARLVTGGMTPEETVFWTWAIEHVE